MNNVIQMPAPRSATRAALTIADRVASRAAMYVTAIWAATGEAPPVAATAWVGSPDGIATAEIQDDHTFFVYTPGSLNEFTNAMRAIPHRPEATGEATLTVYVHCPGGTRHPCLITWPIDLDLARTAVADCTLDHAPELLNQTEPADDTFPYADRERLSPHYADPAASWTARNRTGLVPADERLHTVGN
jgi:hypothetical protein